MLAYLGMKKQFATRIAGSADLYQKNNRKPFHSINFVIAHDGFTLHDLVSYNEKNNRANGENNQYAHLCLLCVISVSISSLVNLNLFLMIPETVQMTIFHGIAELKEIHLMNIFFQFEEDK